MSRCPAYGCGRLLSVHGTPRAGTYHHAVWARMVCEVVRFTEPGRWVPLAVGRVWVPVGAMAERYQPRRKRVEVR